MSAACVEDAVDELVRSAPPATTPARELLGVQFDAGLAWPGFPEGRGGRGLSAQDQSCPAPPSR